MKRNIDTKLLRNAELDFVIQKNEKIIPIEVKAGTKGQMQSLGLFLKERGLKNGIRVSQENFGEFNNIKTVPIYAAGWIVSKMNESKI